MGFVHWIEGRRREMVKRTEKSQNHLIDLHLKGRKSKSGKREGKEREKPEGRQLWENSQNFNG